MALAVTVAADMGGMFGGRRRLLLGLWGCGGFAGRGMGYAFMAQRLENWAFQSGDGALPLPPSGTGEACGSRSHCCHGGAGWLRRSILKKVKKAYYYCGMQLNGTVFDQHGILNSIPRSAPSPIFFFVEVNIFRQQGVFPLTRFAFICFSVLSLTLKLKIFFSGQNVSREDPEEIMEVGVTFPMNSSVSEGLYLPYLIPSIRNHHRYHPQQKNRTRFVQLCGLERVGDTWPSFLLVTLYLTYTAG